MARGKLSVQEKRDIARRQIMDVSLELFLKKGFEETTTRDIIAKAGILNGSLYNRFKSKDEILYTIFEEAVRDALSQFGGYVCEQTLATSVEFSENPENAAQVEWEDGTLKISVKKQ